MVVIAYLPCRWDSGDEAAGPHMDETLTVGTPPGQRSSGDLCAPVPSGAPQPGNAERRLGAISVAGGGAR